MIVYDLETCIMKRGYKREETLILEIAAIDIIGKRSFQSYVNPLIDAEKQLKTPLNQLFVEAGANLRPTNSHIANIGWTYENAEKLETVMQKFIKFVNETKAVEDIKFVAAHNGRSFDHRIVCGALKKLGINRNSLGNINFIDTYYDIAKKTFPRQVSYKLIHLYKAIVSYDTTKVKWHTALDDTQALVDIIKLAAIEDFKNNLINAWDYVTIKPTFLKLINKEFKLELTKNDKICPKAIANIKYKFENNKDLKHNKVLQNIAIQFCIERIWYLRVIRRR